MSEVCHYFGTDGIRGRVGISPITPKFMLKLGWAMGLVLTATTGPRDKILIGKDTRISSDMLESVLAAGLSAAGVDTQLCGLIPTPALAYLTHTFGATAGIMITASHNPYYDNGIKIFSDTGTKLSPTLEQVIETQLSKPMTVIDSIHLGKITVIEDAKSQYITYCKNTIPSQFNLQGLKIVLDCAHGATYPIAPLLFSELGATLILMDTQPDGFNINHKCGSTHPKLLQKRVLSEKADLGIAFDGDGDRVLMIDHTGSLCDGDTLLFILAKVGVKTRSIHGGVVGTLMSNEGLSLAIQALGLAFTRAQVGDWHVYEMLHQMGWPLGGESSGHIICKDITNTGDGIITALQILAACQSQESSLYELKSGFKPLPYRLININASHTTATLECAPVQQALKVAQKNLGSQSGRILLRASGTEPLIRVMVEGQCHHQVNQTAQQLAKVISENT